ncbi:rubrerythrin family protein [Anaeromicropila herbilytica]|uniref:Rubrerythrin n=1 Tax=Anaeromicropila herbilytica TaxID=2785025 RepID=A0A7R7IDA6_9FIRM|nr:rubrerythrin family protein [Anaeromicropila herbilytica]BCN30726.1 rubrerythrin [Anaeromicropila herbilytica]
MDFKQSKTYNNLLTAYEKELELSAKYLIYRDIANREGFIEIGNIYEVTSRNNKEHARIWLRRLNEGKLPTTQEALTESTADELKMASEMYQGFSTIAKEEGYDDIAALFNGVSNIDFNHSSRFEKLRTNVANNQVFCKPEETLWICMQCGNIMSGLCAPDICPVCGFPNSYYRLFDEMIDY